MNIEEFFMYRAIKLAQRGIGSTSPNPLVGAVIVKQGKVIGEGYHKNAGGPHAEIEALRNAREPVQDATLYVNLEPCSHYGKTPPCTQAIINSGILRVVIGMKDPNPKVRGQGIRYLQEAGIEVTVGVLWEESMKLNEVFIKYITQNKPFVVAKIAQSLDGKIALSSGESKWITGPDARKKGHELRNAYDGIMVGIGTVLADNPRLTCRLPRKVRDPIKIILDSSARLPMDSNVVKGNPENLILATTQRADASQLKALEAMGIKIIQTSGKERVNLEELFIELGRLDITSLLVEGGPKVLTSLFQKKLVDKLVVFLAPKLIGGDGKSALGNLFINDIRDVYEFHISHIEKLSEDVMLTMYPKG